MTYGKLLGVCGTHAGARGRFESALKGAGGAGAPHLLVGVGVTEPGAVSFLSGLSGQLPGVRLFLDSAEQLAALEELGGLKPAGNGPREALARCGGWGPRMLRSAAYCVGARQQAQVP